MLVRGVSDGHSLATWSLHSSKELLHRCRGRRAGEPREICFLKQQTSDRQFKQPVPGGVQAGRQQGELILNEIPGPIYVIINAWRRLLQIGNKIFVVGDSQLNFHLLLVNDQVPMKMFPNLNGRNRLYRLKGYLGLYALQS